MKSKLLFFKSSELPLKYDKANLFLVLCQEIQKSEECIHADIEKAKASILVLATHGELVPQDPSEEPASNPKIPPA